jgi:hypothetical protein
MTIDINNNQVFGGTASQSPAWGPRFAMHYYSVKLSRESTTTTIKAQSTPFVIPDGKDLVVNGTSSETTMMK